MNIIDKLIDRISFIYGSVSRDELVETLKAQVKIIDSFQVKVSDRDKTIARLVHENKRLLEREA